MKRHSWFGFKAFVIISALQLFSARREPPFMVINRFFALNQECFFKEIAFVFTTSMIMYILRKSAPMICTYENQRFMPKPEVMRHLASDGG